MADDSKTHVEGLGQDEGIEPGAVDVMQQELECPELPVNHPHPQPHLGIPHQRIEGDTTYVETCQGIFPELDPFCYPPGTNNLPTIYTNVFDSSQVEMPNTLPSTPSVPYNLHDGEPYVTEIDPRSPTDDLRAIFDDVAELITAQSAQSYWARFGDCIRPDVDEPLPEEEINVSAVQRLLRRAIDILEGNRILDRGYSGFPLLHYNGPNKIKAVRPVEDGLGKIISGNVDVHQIWYDSHIESDTALLDLSKLKDKDDEWIKDKEGNEITWTITYTIDVLRRGKDDFSPMTMYFDDPKFQPPKKDCEGKTLPEQKCKPPLPNIAMDQTFFPIQEGTRTILKVKMAPPKYFNLTYTWGWRQHPPRVQVMENAGKELPPCSGKKLPDFEIEVFGKNPMSSKEAKRNAIEKISDLSPTKRMWTAFKAALQAIKDPDPDYKESLWRIRDAWCAYHEWKDRNHLPSGVQVDPDTDLTLLYVNNTIYGELRDGGLVDFPQWRTRGTQLKVTLYNGDYFKHAYLNIDFGGARGWESQFKSSVKVAGSGCRFSFGRFYWSMNLKEPVVLKEATKDTDGKTDYESTKQKVFITYNFEPSRRLRFYQFDPMHHDVAVYSLH
ncbi:MAG: hypothetical protein NVSMB38_18210 [Ktedonobacteraceae bacterium]